MEYFEVGKLYQEPRLCFLIFPTKRLSKTASRNGWKLSIVYNHNSEVEVTFWRDFWTKILECPIYYSKQGEIFMILETETNLKVTKNGVEQFLKVLFASGKTGWISAGTNLSYYKRIL